MNKKLKSLITSGIIALSMVGGSLSISSAMSYMYTNSAVNLRQYNSTTSKKICTVPKGGKVAVYKTVNGWYSVQYNGKWGYIKKEYVGTKTPSTNISTNKGIILKKLIIVNSNSNYLYYYENGNLVKSFRCATGKPSTPTPNGSFTVINKQMNRPYYKKGIAGGAKNNPLGTRFLQLTSSGYAIHGTCYPNSIGTRASDGCIRLLNVNVEWLYSRVPVGTKVIITNKAMINRQVAQLYGYKVN